jgi:hypothetical protein
MELVVSEDNYIINLYTDDAKAFAVGGRDKQARIVYQDLYR